MRTHRLADIPLPGREKILSQLPNFDLYEVGRAVSLAIDFGLESGTPSAVLKLAYPASTATHVLTLRLNGIRELILPEMRPMLVLPELEIEDVRKSQLEGIGYEIVSWFERDFRCSCAEISVEGFEPMSGP